MSAEVTGPQLLGLWPCPLADRLAHPHPSLQHSLVPTWPLDMRVDWEWEERRETGQREARWPLSGFNKHLTHPGILLKCRFSFMWGVAKGLRRRHS